MKHNGYRPRVSCVICTYRRTDVLSDSIDSVMHQSVRVDEYEIVVVDNNSGDTTKEIVQGYMTEASSNLHYVLEHEQGLSHARNTGIRHAKSDIVAFLDDDAKADRGWLAALLEIYDHAPDVWAVGGKVLPIWDVERPEWVKDPMLRSLSLVDWGNASRPLKWPERIIGTNCSFRTQVFKEVGLFAINLGRRGTLLLGNEDTEIQQRIHQLGKSVFYTPHAVVYHHVSRERMTKRYFYNRAYGTGRSQVILMAHQHGAGAMLRMALRSVLVLPMLCLAWAVRGKGKRVGNAQMITYQLGVIHQVFESLLPGKDRTESGTAP